MDILLQGTTTWQTRRTRSQWPTRTPPTLRTIQSKRNPRSLSCLGRKQQDTSRTTTQKRYQIRRPNSHEYAQPRRSLACLQNHNPKDTRIPNGSNQPHPIRMGLHYETNPLSNPTKIWNCPYLSPNTSICIQIILRTGNPTSLSTPTNKTHPHMYGTNNTQVYHQQPPTIQYRTTSTRTWIQP